MFFGNFYQKNMHFKYDILLFQKKKTLEKTWRKAKRKAKQKLLLKTRKYFLKKEKNRA